MDFVEGKPHNIFGSAPTGIWQTTMTTLCYGYPEGHELQHVRLWDTAGCGTHQHPSDKYFQEKVLYAFDLIMVVAENELGEYENKILESAQKQKIPVVVVITKAEEKVQSKTRKLFNTRNPPLPEYERIVPETIEEARQHVNTCLETKGLHDIPVFVVSSWKYRDLIMDIEALENMNHQGVFPVEVSGQDNSNRDINIDTVRDRADSIQTIAERETRLKNMLLSCEMSHLLVCIADTAIQRRL